MPAKAGAACVADTGKKNSVKDTDYGYYLGVREVVPAMKPVLSEP